MKQKIEEDGNNIKRLERLVAKSNIEVTEVTKIKNKEIKKLATKLAQAEKNAQIEDKKAQLLLKKKICALK